MGANKAVLYIKAEQNVEVQKTSVTLGDVLNMECADKVILPKIRTLPLVRFHDGAKDKDRMAVSILKVLECIQKAYPNLDIQNLGESDFLVTFRRSKKKNRVLYDLKVLLVVMVCFFGSAFSIMAFNNDVEIGKLFDQVYELVMGQKEEGFTVLDISYSVGIGIGILGFFNHFGKLRFSKEPTPMEVEMRLYEKDIQTTLIENASRKGQEVDVAQGSAADRSGT